MFTSTYIFPTKNILSIISCSDGEVPGSAVLFFDVELVDVEEGLPEGYMFIWDSDVSPNLFSDMDKNKDAQVEKTEVYCFILRILSVRA